MEWSSSWVAMVPRQGISGLAPNPAAAWFETSWSKPCRLTRPAGGAQFGAKFSGGRAEVPAEGEPEVIRILVAARIGDLGEGEGRVGHHHLGVFEMLPLHFRVDRGS